MRGNCMSWRLTGRITKQEKFASSLDSISYAVRTNVQQYPFWVLSTHVYNHNHFASLQCSACEQSHHRRADYRLRLWNCSKQSCTCDYAYRVRGTTFDPTQHHGRYASIQQGSWKGYTRSFPGRLGKTEDALAGPPTQMSYGISPNRNQTYGTGM
jgi:ribosomal protein L37AE/L43A